MTSNCPPPELVAAQHLVAIPAVLDALRSTGVLARLVDGPATADEMAGDLGLDPDGLRRLCTAVERLGVLARDGDRWTTTLTTTGIAEAELLWSALPGVLAGKPRPHRSDDASQAAASYPTVVPRLAAFYGDAPARLAAALPAMGGRILDVGAGAAPWAIAMLQAWPGAHATALDLPGVVDVTARTVAEHGLTDRFDIIAADVWGVEFEPHFDLVMLGGVCHLFETERVATLLARVVQWLAPGGRLVIVDAGSSESNPSESALHHLSLWLRGGGGHRNLSTHLRWLVDAGLSGATTVDLDDRRLVAVTATLEDQR